MLLQGIVKSRSLENKDWYYLELSTVYAKLSAL